MDMHKRCLVSVSLHAFSIRPRYVSTVEDRKDMLYNSIHLNISESKYDMFK